MDQRRRSAFLRRAQAHNQQRTSVVVAMSAGESGDLTQQAAQKVIDQESGKASQAVEIVNLRDQVLGLQLQLAAAAEAGGA